MRVQSVVERGDLIELVSSIVSIAGDAGLKILELYDSADLDVVSKHDDTPLTPVSYTHLTLPTKA